jgi:hypothetical protein
MIANAAITRGKGKAVAMCAWSTPRFGRDSPPVGGIGQLTGQEFEDVQPKVGAMTTTDQVTAYDGT